MPRILLNITFLFIITIASGQCDGDYELYTQSDIDSFFIKNGFCEEVNKITIGRGSATPGIVDLSPLLGIKKVESLFLTYLPDCNSLHGLDSLETIGNFNFTASGLTDVSALSNLKYVRILTHSYGETPNTTNDLSMYPSLVEISERLIIDSDTRLSGINTDLIPSQSENPDFFLNLRFTRVDNDFTELIEPERRDFPGLAFYRVNADHLSLKGLENIEFYSSFNVLESEELDLSLVTHLNTHQLSIEHYFNDDAYTFSNIDSLKNLIIIDYRDLNNIGDLITNVKTVSEFFQISDNEDLTDISILNDIELPHKQRIDFSPFTRPYNIMVTNNPNLDTCNLDLFCRALHEYPDSILIENNGIACTLEEVKNYCRTVSTLDIEEKNITIFPNPANQNITIASDYNIEGIEIMDISGKLILNQKEYDLPINVEHYNPGTYIMKIYTDRLAVYKRFVVME
jgi:hypothetical protein